MIEVRVEMSTLGNIKTEWWVVVVASQEVVWVIHQSWVVRCCLGQIWRPNTKVCILSLMDSHVWWPHSIMNLSLSEVPLLEVVTSMLLMTWMDLWKEDHFWHKLSLIETLVHKQIIFLMDSSMATLTSSLEHLEASPKSQ